MRSIKIKVTTQVDGLKVDRLKEKTCAITQSQDRLDTLAGECVMDDHYCPSVFSLQPKHLSSYADSKISNDFEGGVMDL